MKNTIGIFILLTFFITLTVQAENPRSLRSVGPNPGAPGFTVEPLGADQDYDTLRYEDPESVPYLWSIPDEKGNGDHTLNVRFTPEYAPFYLMEVHIPLFDMFGNQGTPNMRVSVWTTGDIDSVPGYPSELWDDINIPFEELQFSGQEPILNIINLRELEINSGDIIDFHIGVDTVECTEYDTLGIYFDDGEYSEHSRSGIWDGYQEVWAKMEEVMELPHNFAIHAVISPEPDGVPTILRPSQPPRTVILHPAYPNPFNNRTSIIFNVPYGNAYNITLHNYLGQEVRSIQSGVGSGENKFILDANDIPAGIYYLKLTTPKDNAASRIVLMK